MVLKIYLLFSLAALISAWGEFGDVAPQCSDDKCDWCLSCKCEDIYKEFNVSSSQSAKSSSYSEAHMKMVDKAVKHVDSYVKILTEAQEEVQSAYIHITDASKLFSDACIILHTYLKDSSCSLLSKNTFVYKYGKHCPIPRTCYECQRAFHKGSQTVLLGIQAVSKSREFAYKASKLLIETRSQAVSIAKAVGKAQSNSLGLAVAASQANSESYAAVEAAVKVNCSGVFYFYELTSRSVAEAETLSLAAADGVAKASAKAMDFIDNCKDILAEIKGYVLKSREYAAYAIKYKHAAQRDIYHGKQACLPYSYY